MTSRFAIAFVALLLSACGGQDASFPGRQDKSAGPAPSLKTEVTWQPVASDYQNVVQELYMAYFGRPADPAGLANFENALLAINAPTTAHGLAQTYSSNPGVASLVDAFGASAESKTLYGSGNSTSFVTAIFSNVVGRTPAASGLQFWSAAIDSGSLTRGNAALSILAGALTNTTPQGLIDGGNIDLRLQVASYFTATVAMQNAQTVYSGAAAAASARSALSEIPGIYGSSYYGAVEDAVWNLYGTAMPNVQIFAGALSVAANGPAGLAGFNQPGGVAVDASGNVFVADTNDNMVREITPAGIVSTLAGSGNCGSADGVGSAASFCKPMGIAVDGEDNVFVTSGATVRKITRTGVTSTVAGNANTTGGADGTGVQATFTQPAALAVDAGGTLYVADAGNNTVRKIGTGGVVTTLAGKSGVYGMVDGLGAKAQFDGPSGIVVAQNGTVYVSDRYNNAIRSITPAGQVSTLAGGSTGTTDGQGSAAGFNNPLGLAFDASGNILVCDFDNEVIRRVTPSGLVTTLAGHVRAAGPFDGMSMLAYFYGPAAIATGAGGSAYVADSLNNTIRRLDSSYDVVTFAGVAPAPSGYTNVINTANGLAVDGNGNVYVVDQFPDVVRKVLPYQSYTYLGERISTLAGEVGISGHSNGASNYATFDFSDENMLIGAATDPQGNVYVSDVGNFTIRKITPQGVTSTFAGMPMVYGNADGTGSAARFGPPAGLACDPAGNLYVADPTNAAIRKITPAGVVTTLAGSGRLGDNHDGVGTGASINNPDGVAVDAKGNVYVTQLNDNLIRKIEPDGTVTTIAGIAKTAGFQNGPGATATFSEPHGIAVDASGNIFVSEVYNDDIRMITPSGVVSTYAGVSGQWGGFVPGKSLAGYLPAGGALAIHGNALYMSVYSGILVFNNIP